MYAFKLMSIYLQVRPASGSRSEKGGKWQTDAQTDRRPRKRDRESRQPELVSFKTIAVIDLELIHLFPFCFSSARGCTRELTEAPPGKSFPEAQLSEARPRDLLGATVMLVPPRAHEEEIGLLKTCRPL